MSIIQDIRDKYARISVIAIALALIGFILTDYIRGKDRQRGATGANSVGSVNGKSISAQEFQAMVEQANTNYEQQGYPAGPETKQRAIDQVWDQQVNTVLVEGECDKIGMHIGKKERGDILFGENGPQDFKNAGTDENGNYDPARARQQIEQFMKDKKTSPEQKDQLKKYMEFYEFQRKQEKYMSLFYKSANVPKWMVEKQIADNSLIAKATVAKVLYSDSIFRDTTIKISDKEIQDYINKHKEDYKQDETRSINFVTFSAAPTSADSLAIKNQVAALKAEFDSTKDVKMFLQGKGSSDFSDKYSNASQLSPIAKDSIIRLAKNAVYGPYLDGGNYMLAKLIDTKTLPDSAKAKHILIQTYDPQAKKQLLDDSTAKKRIDSISLAIKNGANFDSLAKKFSDDNKGPDGGSAAKGGDLGWFGYGRMVPEFNDFCFEKPVGSRDIVKTSFGYHLIEVTGQKSPQLNYKVAYLTERIVASQQTEDNAVQQATDFAGDVKDPKSFDAAYEKTLKPKGINKGIGIDIKRTDGSVRGLGFSRQLIKDIYAAKPGEVLRPIQVGNDWVVAVVTESISEGTQSVTKVRPGVEPLLRNKKIAEQLKQKIGKVSKIEAAASVMGKQPQIVDSLRMSAPQALLSYDPKVFGAIFNPANKGKIVPEAIIGDQGVYVVQVDNVTATAPENSNVAEMRKNQAGQTANDPIGALKKAASIKDKRSSGIY